MGKLIANKYIQYTIIFAIVLLLVYLSYKFIGKVSGDFKKSAKNKHDKKDLDAFLSQHTTDVGGSHLDNVKTYDAAEYNLMADALYSAMDGMGSDEDTIFAILSRLRTKADYFELSSSFGVRKTSSYLSSFQGGLTKWLTDEIGGDDKVKINNLLGKFNVQI